MAEESNDGTMSGLLKTIIGTVGTIVTAGGAYLGSQMFGGGEAAQPAQQAAPVINITQQQAQQAAPAGKTVIIERPAAGAAGAAAPAKPKPKTAKEELEEAPKW